MSSQYILPVDDSYHDPFIIGFEPGPSSLADRFESPYTSFFSGSSLVQPSLKSALNDSDEIDLNEPYIIRYGAALTDDDLRAPRAQTLATQRCLPGFVPTGYEDAAWSTRYREMDVLNTDWQFERTTDASAADRMSGYTSGVARSVCAERSTLDYYLLSDNPDLSEYPISPVYSSTSCGSVESECWFSSLPTIAGIGRCHSSNSSSTDVSAWPEFDSYASNLSEPYILAPIYELEPCEIDRCTQSLDGKSSPVSPGQQKFFECMQLHCSASFTHSADLNRHVKTIHSKEGQTYRCAFPGCPKADKTWIRLDSFRTHAKQHKPEDVDRLVQDSRTEVQHGLPISVTTQNMMSHRGLSRSRSRLSIRTARRSRTS